MFEFLKLLIYEKGEPSRTGLIAIILAIFPLSLWAFVTLYCLLTKYTFPHYDTFTAAIFGTSVSGLGGIVGNKYVNARYNAPEGVPYAKRGINDVPTNSQISNLRQ